MRILRWMTMVLALAAGTLGLATTRSSAAALPSAGAIAAGTVETPMVSQARWYYRRVYYRPVRRYAYRPYRRYGYYRPYRRYYYRPYRRHYYRPYYRRYYHRPRFYIGF